MQMIKEQADLICHGKITAEWRRPDGEVVHAVSKENVVTFSAADIMANMLAGNNHFVPTHIGYVFGPSAAVMQNPSSAAPKRQHPWSTIVTDVEAIGGNIIASPLSAAPLIRVDGDSDLYAGNAVVLAAVSDSTSNIVLQGGGFSVVGPQPTSDKYFQVVLMSQVVRPGSATPEYIPFARAQLTAGNDGLVVQSDFELAVFWTISFR